jgi:tetratricopeptide (TPR) repeat protein
VVKEAELWRAGGEPLRAIEVITQALGSLQPTDSDRAKLLAQRGLALYETNRHYLAFVDLEKSIELNPGDSDLRFKLAWRYSEQGWEAVAAAHYKVLGQDPKRNATALNNLGWSARAAGNYALLALEAGLLNQVRGYIERGLELDNTDDQVARAVARLAEQESVEEKTLEELEEVGRDGRRIVAALQDSDGDLPTGRWILMPGGIVEFENDESLSEGTNDQTKVVVYPADEIGPMTMRWAEGDLAGSEGPVRIKGDVLEGVMIDSTNGRVRTIGGRRWAGPPSPEGTTEGSPGSEENGQ